MSERDEWFIAFVTAQLPALLRTAMVLTGSAAAAEELVQDTLARLYPRWSKVQAASSPADYAQRSLINQHVSVGRRRHPVPVDAIPESASVSDFAGQLEDRAELRQLLGGLSRRQRTALALRYFHDLDDAAIAEAMGCRVGTVRSLTSRALTSLRTARPRDEEQIL